MLLQIMKRGKMVYGGNSSGNLMTGTQASGAEVETLRLTIYDDGYRVNIGCPAPIGASLGMTDIMTKKRGFPA